MSLLLDPRHRAMLAEMKLPLWWPEAPQATGAAAPGPHRPDPATRAAAGPQGPADPGAGVPPPPQAPLRAAPPWAAPPPTPTPPQAADRTPDGAIPALAWPQLRQAVAECRRCRLCETRRNTVFGVGPTTEDRNTPPEVDWLIVGEAPGENEDLQGEPFVGQAGKLLDNMLRAAGLSRTGQGRAGAQALRPAYIANVIKCRPPGNRNPEPDEVLRCLPYLQGQIALLRPRLILALGRFAAHALLADTVPQVHTLPLGKLRGRVHHYQGLPVVVSYHPAYLLRNLPDKAKAWEDLGLALDTAPPKR